MFQMIQRWFPGTVCYGLSASQRRHKVYDRKVNIMMCIGDLGCCAVQYLGSVPPTHMHILNATRRNNPDHI
jgi:hypothetical protein